LESLVDEAVGDRALTALADGSVIVISKFIGALHALVRRIEDLEIHGAIRVGVSRAAADGNDLRRVHAQARFAASVSPDNTRSSISWFDDCDLLQLLSRHADDETIDRSIADILTRLRELLGEDLRDPDRRFEMSLALRLRERRTRVS